MRSHVALVPSVKRPRKRDRHHITDILKKWGIWCSRLEDDIFSSGKSVLNDFIEYRTAVSSGARDFAPSYYPDHEVTDLHRRIVKLPDEDKDILVYYYVAGCSYGETAIRIGKYKMYVCRKINTIIDALV